MKKFFSMMAIALAAVAFVGCDKGGEDDPTPGGGDGVVALATPAPTVDQASVTTNSFTVAWPAVQGAIGYLYSVNDGAPQSLAINSVQVTGLTADTTYTFKVRALSGDTAKNLDSDWGSCTVTTKAASQGGTSSHACLNGTDYYLILLDATSYESVKDRVKADYRPNDTTNFLYVWEETLLGGSPSGRGYYGNAGEAWTSLIYNGKGWFGAGFFSNQKAELDKLAEIAKVNGEGYYLHMAWMGTYTGTYSVVMYDNSAEAKVYIGDENAEYGFKRDGEWHEIEIPMTVFFGKGLYYRAENIPAEGMNVLAVVQGDDGTMPAGFDIDAFFIYKK